MLNLKDSPKLLKALQLGFSLPTLLVTLHSSLGLYFSLTILYFLQLLRWLVADTLIIFNIVCFPHHWVVLL